MAENKTSNRHLDSWASVYSLFILLYRLLKALTIQDRLNLSIHSMKRAKLSFSLGHGDQQVGGPCSACPWTISHVWCLTYFVLSAGLAQQINKPNTPNNWNQVYEYPSPFFSCITKSTKHNRERREYLSDSIDNHYGRKHKDCSGINRGREDGKKCEVNN